MITLYAKQKKRHRCTEQTFGLCGRRRGWDVSENSIETCILSRVKQITSPGWIHDTSARAWCTGKTQRDRVEREVGGGIGMGNTCKSMIHVNVWQKPLQYCKVISLQLIKINGKKLKIIIKKKPLHSPILHPQKKRKSDSSLLAFLDTLKEERKQEQKRW